jgi:hypothetical protein
MGGRCALKGDIPPWRRKESSIRDWKLDLNFRRYFHDDDLKEKYGVTSEEVMERYVWPSKGDEYIFESLSFHAGRNAQARNRCIPPTSKERDYVLNSLEEVYRPAINAFWRLKRQEPNQEWFLRALSKLDMNSSPGWPWKADFKDNRSLLLNPDGEYNHHNVQMVFYAFKERLRELNLAPKADDINVFIKDELHKQSKMRDGAWRLISAVSITDCLVDRFLFGDFFDQLYTLDGYTKTPNKAGWVPYLGGYKWFYRRYANKRALMADKSSWDWTVQEWKVQVLTEFMVRVCSYEDGWMERLIRNRMMALFRLAVFNVGGHTRLQQNVWGIMKSGCLGTLAWNGKMQVMCDLLAKLRLHLTKCDVPDATGDDTVQETPFELLDGQRYYIPEKFCEELGRTGCIIKEYTEHHVSGDRCVEFMGTRMFSDHSIPSYSVKHLAALMTQSDFKKEMIESYMRLYAFDPYMFSALRHWSLDLGSDEVISRRYACDWYDGRAPSTDEFHSLEGELFVGCY